MERDVSTQQSDDTEADRVLELLTTYFAGDSEEQIALYIGHGLCEYGDHWDICRALAATIRLLEQQRVGQA